MCTLTDTLKFCTCLSKSADALQHYWQLHRRNKEKNIIIVGEMILPNLQPNFELNYEVLNKRLRDEDAFDFDTQFLNNDLLEVVFYNHDYEKRMEFGFKFKKGVWVKQAFDNFCTTGHCDIVAFGKMKK